NRDPDTDLLRPLLADGIESGSVYLERKKAPQQMSVLLHAATDGRNVKVSDRGAGVNIDGREQQDNSGKIRAEKLENEATIPQLFHRTCNLRRGGSESTGVCGRPSRWPFSTGGCGRQRSSACQRFHRPIRDRAIDPGSARGWDFGPENAEAQTL